MATITATPESIALAAGLIGQTKGDLAQARRAAGEAFAWLQSIDPSYKPEPVKSADQRTDELRGSDGWIDPDIALLIRKLENAERKAAERDDLLAQREEWKGHAKKFCEERDQARRDAAKLPDVIEDRDQWRHRAETAERTLANRAPAPIAAPRPAPQAPVKPQPAQAPAADPYAALPPKMRAFLATQASKLEID